MYARVTLIHRLARLYRLVFLCGLVVLSGCEQKSQPGVYAGYVEGVYRFIAAPYAGRLVDSPLQVGMTVNPDTLAFRLDTQEAQLALQQAQARVKVAKESVANLQHGKRTQELDGMRAQIQSLTAELEQVQKNAARYGKLAKSGAVPRIQAEQAETRKQQLEAQIAALDADISAAQLPARSAQIGMAHAEVEAAKVALAMAEVQLQKRSVQSQMAGYVTEVYVHSGEYVRPGQAVVKILLPDALKVIFYVPEGELAGLRIGDRVSVSGHSIAKHDAVIETIADAAEFTPPVIYSEQTSSKLIFRVTALLDKPDIAVGLPVSVEVQGE